MDIKIKFRAFEIGDEVFINMLRDDEERESLIGGHKRFVSLERERKWVHDIILGDSQTTIYVAITLLNSDDIIGYVSISDIDYRNGTCFWSGIKLAREQSGKGLGLQALLLSVKYVFEELRMVRCISLCQETHMAMRRVSEKAGFRLEGILRKSLYKNGQHINQCLYSITDDDYADVKGMYKL